LKFQPATFFKGIEYLGEFPSLKQIYYIYRKTGDYILVTLSKTKLDSFNASFIKGKYVDFMVRKYAGKIIDRRKVEEDNPRTFGKPSERAFKILNIFYILCILGKAKKIEDLNSRGLKFKITKGGV
jgi:hypothetical protein